MLPIFDRYDRRERYVCHRSPKRNVGEEPVRHVVCGEEASQM
jgi:hypothetical protein